jgi:hypothetical protein
MFTREFHRLFGAARPAQRSAADRRVEFELERRWLERLVGRSGSPALGPMRDDVVSPAASVRDAPVKRLDRQPAGRVAGDERVEAASEAINLDDVPDLNALEPHPHEGYGRGHGPGSGRGRRRQYAGQPS